MRKAQELGTLEDLFWPLFNRDESLKLAENKVQHAEWRERAHDVFLGVAQRAGASAEWRAAAGPVHEVASLHARHADLLVLGQHDPEDPESYVARSFVEDAVMSSGVPAVIVPRSGRISGFSDEVLIGWDGGVKRRGPWPMRYRS
ncbi:universal stress protein family protein [Caballeronia arationis]|uniref:Universal stress protein family protein n=1 Tax=Caballeronia arationis TaxID=1777142 RepID=A0A7Z7N2K8_9BURK|nr:hypothetical protein [Caballeronia arationis]SAL04766.1 universal stress protein family protein [Caballeronia arationis]SOE67132.1 hypothetical protein SAMN05446927_3230 [Caballeronia arationis]